MINDETTLNLNRSKKPTKRSVGSIIRTVLPIEHRRIVKYSLDIHTKTVNMALMSLVMLFMFLVLLGSAFKLQILEGMTNRQFAAQNSLRRIILQPSRGLIVDWKGIPLASNIPSYALELDVSKCRGTDGLIAKTCQSDYKTLKGIFKTKHILSYNELTKKIEAGALSIVIANDLTKEDTLLFDIANLNSRNFYLTAYSLRQYKNPAAFAHLLGYVGLGDTIYPSIQGKVGVEKYYDTHLKGIQGERVYQTSASGYVDKLLSEKQPISGLDLRLSVDEGLQSLAYDLLSKRVDGAKTFGGSVVAQDPYTGRVLALVSYPSYNSTNMSQGISTADYQLLLANANQPFFNRSISGAYPPGSTFKMTTALGVLMEEVIDPTYTITDPGYISIGGSTFRNWKLDGHGRVDLLTALQKSNDTYFYTVGGGYGPIKGLGISKLNKWARLLGYGSVTGIDLPGEVAGFMPDGKSRDWYLGDNYITAIGQGDVLATPLQVNNSTAFFANGGTLYKPTVALTEGKGIVIRTNIADDAYIEKIRQGMRLASLPGGTAYPFFDFKTMHGVEVGGKTGTSEYFNKDGKPDTHGWFSVFAPYDKPTIVLTVFLEGGSAGSDDAAKLARPLMDYWQKSQAK